MRVLVVEDDRSILAQLEHQLSRAGFDVDCADTADAFKHRIGLADHTFYLIDLGLPDGSGLDLIRDLRSTLNMGLILVLTGRSDIRDKVRALELGADDYIVKPFHLAELLARMKALLRRVAVDAPGRLCYGQVVLNPSTQQIECEGREIMLRPRELKILVLLLRQSGKLVSRTKIERVIEAEGNDYSPNAVDQLISRLRRKLEGYPTGLHLATVKGVGYLLKPRAG